MKRIFSLEDFEKPAKRKLPRQLFSYIYNGADDEKTLKSNREAFDRYAFIPKVLTGVSERKQDITLFGKSYASPFGIAPVGLSAMWSYRGDITLAQAAHENGIPAIMSGASLIPMETVSSVAPDTWFQAYMPGDPARVEALINRISNAGFKVLVITVDLPVQVNPENYLRNGFSTPLRPSLRLAWDGISHPRWLFSTFFRTVINHGIPHFENWRAERGAPIISASVERDFQSRDHLNWSHLERIRKMWKGPMLVKGILSPNDAAIATGMGVDGLIISNHGGRQVDGAISPLDVLPEISRVAGGATILMDSGIRRGSDVLKALALGAHCVLLGRSFNYAATIGGKQGVHHAIRILRTEVDRNMALLGINNLNELDTSVVRDLNLIRRH